MGFFLYRLLAHAYMTHCPLPTVEGMLNTEIGWLKKTKVGRTQGSLPCRRSEGFVTCSSPKLYLGAHWRISNNPFGGGGEGRVGTRPIFGY